MIRAFILLLMLCSPAVAHYDAAPKVELLHTELDAVGWTLDALLKYPANRRHLMRFVYVPAWGDAEWIGATDSAVNMAAGHSTVLVRGDVHAGGWLLAYDLERLAGGNLDILKRLVQTWDELAVREARFHVPELNLEKRKNKAALLAPHLQEAIAQHATKPEKSERLDVLVTDLTKSTGAIYPADFLIEQLLTSVRGKYPEFRQIDFEVKQFTPLQALLKKRGFFFEQSSDAAADKGAILLISDITFKNRVIVTTYGLLSRQPAVLTFDTKDLRTRAAEQFARNLIEYQNFSDASEIFIPMPNGLVEYVLADAKGNITRVAPPDVAADHTKPAGATHELEMGMSCVMCHFPDGGYKLRRNDLELLVGSDTDFLGDDLSFTDRQGKKVTLSFQQAVAVVASRFGEPIYEADGILGRTERDFARAIDALTEYEVKADGPGVVQQLGVKLREIYHGYRFQAIDAQRACLELGVRVAKEQASAVLRQLVPPPPAGGREDILIGLLRAGASIKRDDMDSIHVEMARRALVTRPTLIPEGSQ